MRIIEACIAIIATVFSANPAPELTTSVDQLPCAILYFYDREEWERQCA